MARNAHWPPAMRPKPPDKSVRRYRSKIHGALRSSRLFATRVFAPDQSAHKRLPDSSSPGPPKSARQISLHLLPNFCILHTAVSFLISATDRQMSVSNRQNYFAPGERPCVHFAEGTGAE